MPGSSAPVASWRVDKTSRVPIYLQLRDFVRYAVSTGAIKKGEQLPGVVELASALGINFETVRKAYKELEAEGLIQMQRGRGSFVGPAAPSAPSAAAPDPTGFAERHLREAVAQAMAAGLGADQIREAVEQMLRDATAGQFLLFTECNPYEVAGITPLLRAHLGVDVRGVLLADLASAIADAQQAQPPVAVITTGFHLSEVRRIAAGFGVDVEAVVTNMSPETRRLLERFPKDARVGFVCRDAHSIPFYRDMLKAELGLVREPTCFATEGAGDLAAFLRGLDVVLTSPPAFEPVSALAGQLPVHNVLDRVDPVSLHAIRERLYRDWRPASAASHEPPPAATSPAARPQPLSSRSGS